MIVVMRQTSVIVRLASAIHWHNSNVMANWASVLTRPMCATVTMTAATTMTKRTVQNSRVQLASSNVRWTGFAWIRHEFVTVSMTVRASQTRPIAVSLQGNKRVARTSFSVLAQHLPVAFWDSRCLVCRDLGIAMVMWTARMALTSLWHVGLRHVMLAISSVAITSVYRISGSVMET